MSFVFLLFTICFDCSVAAATKSKISQKTHHANTRITLYTRDRSNGKLTKLVHGFTNLGRRIRLTGLLIPQSDCIGLYTNHTRLIKKQKCYVNHHMWWNFTILQKESYIMIMKLCTKGMSASLSWEMGSLIYIMYRGYYHMSTNMVRLNNVTYKQI